jgi:D-tagatose-1,6-bisphosphate aldolase subunit GatZ/KbaZ
MEGTAGFARLDELRWGALRGARVRLKAFMPVHDSATRGELSGVTSVCSAHPMVVEAAIRQAASDGTPVLIEATCNQVNHQGGYTGLTPAAFRDKVYSIADQVGFPRQRVVLGGDHLGPNPWRHLGPEAALQAAEAMVAAYVSAGYRKIHLDTSVGCKGDPEHLPDSITAERAARLAVVAERSVTAGSDRPCYVIGTEVPVPGGAVAQIESLEVTRPEAVVATVEAHRRAFVAAGAGIAFDAVVAVVAQPGVEFDNRNVVVYQPERARALSAVLDELPGLVFEAHSTDYQPPESLARLVGDGFAVLKVGPALTFALREALYALDQIAAALGPVAGRRGHSLMEEMETEMLTNPGHWQPYYRGAPDERLLRHFSYSDRIRYYWASPAAHRAVKVLLDRLSGAPIPETLVSQFLPKLYQRVTSGALLPAPRALALESVRDVLRSYSSACRATRAVRQP